MSAEILQHLAQVDLERRRREANPELHRRVMAVKSFQHRRFAHTYSDLLGTERYRRASSFFLDELYGPTEFKERDAQFARIVPKIDSLFPHEVKAVVLELSQLHALSERLDTEMASALSTVGVDRLTYMKAWQHVGSRSDRLRQLALVLGIGRALDHLTRHGWLVAALRLMRGPARAAGLGALQTFLESGMASFQSMRGATEFLLTIEHREHRILNALFEGDASVLFDLPQQ